MDKDVIVKLIDTALVMNDERDWCYCVDKSQKVEQSLIMDKDVIVKLIDTAVEQSLIGIDVVNPPCEYCSIKNALEAARKYLTGTKERDPNAELAGTLHESDQK